MPVLEGTSGATSLADAAAFLKSGPIMLKAVAGGGGRGMRPVTKAEELDSGL